MLSKARFHELLAYTRKRERSTDGMFFVDGWRWLDEALALPDPPRCVLAVPGAARTPVEAGLLERARARAEAFFEATHEQLARLTGSVQSPGVAALVRWRPAAFESFVTAVSSTGPALVIALDAVGDPGNAGTIVRTADWFNAAGVLFGGGSVEPANPKTVRATMGSLFHLPIGGTEALAPAVERLRVGGFVAVGATLDGNDANTFQWPGRCVLVIGNEANGIQPEVTAALDHRVRIPAYGRAESLNAAVAAALLMADWRRIAGQPAG